MLASGGSGPDQHVDRRHSRPKQDLGAGGRGRAGGEHVVDQHDPASLEARQPRRAAGDGTGDHPRPLLGGAAGEAARGAYPHQPVHHHLASCQPADMAGEQCCLVVAAGKQPAAVQRHRQQQVSLFEQAGAGARHVATKELRVLGAVAIFERQNKLLREIVVVERCARPPPGWRRLHAPRAQPAESSRRRAGEARAAPVATWLDDEAGTLEAARAEPAGLVDHGVAGGALRRQHQIQQHPPAPGRPFDQSIT